MSGGVQRKEHGELDPKMKAEREVKRARFARADDPGAAGGVPVAEAFAQQVKAEKRSVYASWGFPEAVPVLMTELCFQFLLYGLPAERRSLEEKRHAAFHLACDAETFMAGKSEAEKKRMQAQIKQVRPCLLAYAASDLGMNPYVASKRPAFVSWQERWEEAQLLAEAEEAMAGFIASLEPAVGSPCSGDSPLGDLNPDSDVPSITSTSRPASATVLKDFRVRTSELRGGDSKFEPI